MSTDPSVQIDSIVVAITQAAKSLSQKRGVPTDFNDVVEALCLELGVERTPQLLGQIGDAESIMKRLENYDWPSKPVVIETFVLSDHEDAPPQRGLYEWTVRQDGRKWQVHQNDADPFPSNPHAHESGTGIKLCLSTGKYYRKREMIGQMKPKQLRELRERLSNISLPPLLI